MVDPWLVLCQVISSSIRHMCGKLLWWDVSVSYESVVVSDIVSLTHPGNGSGPRWTCLVSGKERERVEREEYRVTETRTEREGGREKKESDWKINRERRERALVRPYQLSQTKWSSSLQPPHTTPPNLGTIPLYLSRKMCLYAWHGVKKQAVLC